MKTLFVSLTIMLGIVANIAAMDPRHPSFLKKMTGLPGQAQIPQQQTVRIQTNDDQEFNVPLTLAKQIPVINKMLEDIGEELATAIPLPTVDAPAFDWILQTLQMLQNNPAAQINTKEFNVDKLINLTNACEYLELDNLQTKLFETLNERKLSETSLKAMNDTALKKFWQQYSAYSYISNLIGLRTEFELPLSEMITERTSIVVSPNGNILISWTEHDSSIKLWNLNPEYQPLPDLHHKLLDGATISPDGTKLISWSSQDGTIKIWNLNDLSQAPRILQQAGTENIFISPDENKLISWYHKEGIIRIWNLNDLHEEPEILQHKNIAGVTISPNENKLISWSLHSPSGQGTIKGWNLNTGEQLFPELQDAFPKTYNEFAILRRIIISPDKNKFVLNPRTSDGTIKIWDLNTGNQLFPELHHEQVKGITTNLDGSKLISWSQQKIKIWNMNNLNQEPDTLQHKRLENVSLSPDGKKLILCFDQPGTIEIWNLYDLHQKPKRLQHPNVDTVITSLNGTKLISNASLWGTVKVWNLTILDELDNLTAQQILFMIWLYENKDLKEEIKSSPSLQQTYQSLSEDLKNVLRKLFPIVTLLEQKQS